MKSVQIGKTRGNYFEFSITCITTLLKKLCCTLLIWNCYKSTVMKIHKCIRLGLKLVLNQIRSDKKTRWPPGSHLEFSFIWIISLPNKDTENRFSPNGSLSHFATVKCRQFWRTFKNKEIAGVLNFKLKNFKINTSLLWKLKLIFGFYQIVPYVILLISWK